MKRIFIVALCVALAVCALAVPASASTYEERWTNVLDYVTVNNSGSNMLALKNGDSFKLDLPSSFIVYDIDIVFRFNSNNITGVKVIRDGGLSWNLTLESIGEGFYRAFGSCGAYSFKSLEVQVFTNKGTQEIFGELLQCHISPSPVDSISVGATVSKDGHVVGPATHSGTSAFAFSDTGDWFVSFTVEDWRQFDYINFGFTTKNITIGSITAKVGPRSVPVIIDSYDGDPYGSYQKMHTGYLDLAGIDHGYGNTLEIYVTGTCFSTAGANLWLSWLRGQIAVDSPSIFALIWQSIKNGFNSVIQWVSNGFNSVIAKLDDFINGTDEQKQAVEDFKENGVTDSIGDMVTKEEALQGSVSTGNAEANTAVGNALDVVLSRSASFACVAWLMGLFFQIDFFTDVLYLSLGLGVLVLVLGLSLIKGKDVTDARKQSTEISVVDKE